MVLTKEKVISVLSFDPESGTICRISARGFKLAGTLHSRGYRHIYVLGRCYKAHRLMWLYVHGIWPDHEIDHKNGDKDDNRIENLREATRSQNEMNKPIQKNSTSGSRGVSFHCRVGMWQARISKNRNRLHLGYFASKEAASIAYQAKATELYGQFVRA